MVRAAVEGASAGRALSRALADRRAGSLLDRPLHVIAAGKAASAMSAALATHTELTCHTFIAVGTHASHPLPAAIEWREAAHPLPDERSVAAGTRALAVAAQVTQDEALVLLLSGGASSLLCLPGDGLTLQDKREAIAAMLRGGADIHAINTVRKHLSRIKGGRLAAACAGHTVTLAVSDVVGDDVSVMGSGPGVADATTWADAASLLDRYAPEARSARAHVARGLRGEISDTPKPGDAALSRASAHVIASRETALFHGAETARSLGYHPVILREAITGEARTAAVEWFERALASAMPHPMCVLSAGETTVRVAGSGRGGRNQEFVLALISRIAEAKRDLILASVGTDGIDGPTDAAGALADRTSRDRATALTLNATVELANNNSYDYFAMLGDLVHLGPTDTNVGDLQVMLIARSQ